MANEGEVSAIRSDLSPYIVHLTRDLSAGSDARSNLVSIVRSRCLEARSAFGIAVRHLELIHCAGDGFMKSQRVTCFSETPPDSLAGLLEPGIYRQYKFRPFGIAFERTVMLARGANPVWYLNGYRGNGFPWRSKDVNRLIDAVAKDVAGVPTPDVFSASSIARLTPFIEVMGSWNTGVGGALVAKDFTFEREWRYQGDFRFTHSELAAVIVPRGQVTDVRRLLTQVGLESATVDAIHWLEL